MLINNGSRDNVGRIGPPGSFVEDAIYIGAVGARFEVPGKMEYQEMIVDRKQNLESKGYGEKNENETLLKIFAKFYGKNNLPTYEEATKQLHDYEQVNSAYN